MPQTGAIDPSTYPDVPLPAGADTDGDSLNDWQVDQGRVYRLVWSRPLPLVGVWASGPHPAEADVRIVATQFADGSLATAGDDAPLVYVGQDDYTPAAARVLATAILAAADMADGWVKR